MAKTNCKQREDARNTSAAHCQLAVHPSRPPLGAVSLDVPTRCAPSRARTWSKGRCSSTAASRCLPLRCCITASASFIWSLCPRRTLWLLLLLITPSTPSAASAAFVARALTARAASRRISSRCSSMAAVSRRPRLEDDTWIEESTDDRQSRSCRQETPQTS